MFSLHSLLVFVHILGAVSLFTALGIEMLVTYNFRRATTPNDARTWFRLTKVFRRLDTIGALTLLISGGGLMFPAWGFQPWIIVGFVGFVIIGGLSGGLSGSKWRQLGQALAAQTGERLTRGYRIAQTNTVLLISLRLRLLVAVGVLGIMTLKADGLDSTLVLVGVLVVGLATGAMKHRVSPEDSHGDASD